jgi:hypothetical protein
MRHMPRWKHKINALAEEIDYLYEKSGTDRWDIRRTNVADHRPRNDF